MKLVTASELKRELQAKRQAKRKTDQQVWDRAFREQYDGYAWPILLRDTDQEQVQRIVEGLNASDREHVYATAPQCCCDKDVYVMSAEDVHARARCNFWCNLLLFVALFAFWVVVALHVENSVEYVIVSAAVLCSAICVLALHARESSWHANMLRLLKEKQKVPDEKV